MLRAVSIAELRPGDRIQVVDKWVPNIYGKKRWNPEGRMDRHLSTVMTVRRIYQDTHNEDCSYVLTEEDRNEFGGSGWMWFPEMIAGVWVDQELDDDTSEWTNEMTNGLFGYA